VAEETDRPAIQVRGSHDLIAGFGQGQEGQGFGSLPRSRGQCRRTAFQGGQALLQDIRGGVHDAGIDVAGLSQAEQVGRVGGIVEGVRGGLVKRYGAGPGVLVRGVSPVDGFGCKTAIFIIHGCTPFIVGLQQTKKPLTV
jgi:hypothetical protein